MFVINICWHMLTLYHHQLPSVTISSTCGIPSCCFKGSHASRPRGGCLWGVRDPPSVCTASQTPANWMKLQSQCVCHCMSLSISFSMNFQIFQMHMIIYIYIFNMVSRRFRLLEVLSRQIGPFIHRRPLLCHASGPHASDLSCVNFSEFDKLSTRTLADLKGLGACLVREAPRLPRLPRLLTSMSQQEATTFCPNSAREYIENICNEKINT